MINKKSELTIESVVIILLVLGLLIISIYLIYKNKLTIEKLLYFFKGLR